MSCHSIVIRLLAAVASLCQIGCDDSLLRLVLAADALLLHLGLRLMT